MVESTSNGVGGDQSGSVVEGGDGMILEVLSDTGEVLNHWNAESLQFSSGSNSGELENLRRTDSTGRDDDFLLGGDFVALSVDVVDENDAGGAWLSGGVLEVDVVGDGVVHDPKVVSVEDGLQVGTEGGDSLSGSVNGVFVETGSNLGFTVPVRVEGKTPVLSSLDEK